ncbi:TRAP transporter substrate-binding protein [Kerstersia sp.]|uniref:TRAP transporter substrate-binding protein n=1 Tax=Kerstersia sp. TaxID=1930783 RepID=UPI003F8EDF1A
MQRHFLRIQTRLAAAAIAGALGLAASWPAMAATHLRLAHASSSDSLVNQAIQRFARQVAEASEGELRVTVFPDGQLGDEAPIVDAVGAGAIDIGLGGAVDGIDPRLNVVTLPFLFRDAANVHAFLDGEQGQALMALGQDHGYVVLAALDSGFRQFANSKHAVTTPEDLASLKIRTPPNPVMLATIRQLGALPQSIPFGEVYTSLQSGVVDGVEPELRDFYDQKWYEVAKHVSLANYIWSANYWFMNKDRYDSLSDAQRQVLQAAVADSVAWYRGELDSAYARLDATLREAGVSFSEVDIALFRDKVGPVYEQFSREWGPAFVEGVRQAADR